jgi:hypothetical protein
MDTTEKPEDSWLQRALDRRQAEEDGERIPVNRFNSYI